MKIKKGSDVCSRWVRLGRRGVYEDIEGVARWWRILEAGVDVRIDPEGYYVIFADGVEIYRGKKA